MVKCIVPGCSITNYNNERKSEFQKTLEQNVKISLHRLPKDVNKRKLWLKNIGLHKDIKLKKSASVCSLHFKEENINRTLDKIFLRENAVPYSNAFVNGMHKQENIENEQNLNSSFSSVDDGNQLSYLETSFSSSDTHCTKKLNMGNQEYNHQEESVSMQADEQILLNECTGELVMKKESLLASELQEHYTTVLDEKFFDKCTSNSKVSRSTSSERLDQPSEVITNVQSAKRSDNPREKSAIERIANAICNDSSNDDVVLPPPPQPDDIDSFLNLLGSRIRRLSEAQKQEAFQKHLQLSYDMLNYL